MFTTGECFFDSYIFQQCRKIIIIISPWIINLYSKLDKIALTRLYLYVDASFRRLHYNDIMMTTMAPEITSLTVVYSIVYSDADQRKHQSSASLAFVRGIHRGPVNSPHKWPVTRKVFPFGDVIMNSVFVRWTEAVFIYDLSAFLSDKGHMILPICA